MKKVAQLTKQIAAQQQIITGLTADRELAERAIAIVEERTAIIDSLREQRHTLQAETLASGKTADTSNFDTQISNAEAQHAAAVAAARAAAESIVPLDAAVELAKNALADLEGQRAAALEAAIMTEHEIHQGRYCEAVAALQACVEGMAGAERAWRLLLNKLPGDHFPGRGLDVIEDIRARGVRVPWEFSRLKDPAVAAGYTDDFRNYWFVPVWAAAERQDIGMKDADDIVNAARRAGFPGDDLVTAPTEPEVPKMVKVRVKRGIIRADSLIKRHPATGAVVSKITRSYEVGDDLELEEATARQLHILGHVVIRGEGELPSRTGIPRDAEKAMRPRLAGAEHNELHRVGFSSEMEALMQTDGNR
ncbi:hypothetical protein CY652_10650 [Burkholderia sp. WAC0059]|uniref:hypothetical protein n=1 Tax=Burkholderia sp. WAC0059 TaxID=2066022 RepID=UPI000C7F54BC|nr:hypothetical protein [Burkholderia sp. WAC0059]PLZ02562.1 hypothetical protein CY652_10650 [Burkholderia sp. WAC0059]